MKHAFSLVELSIVLVILGLLTGGILAGQSLIRAAELRTVTTEFNNYKTALRTFQGKYFALPGDMSNATAFWTEMTNCGAASPAGSGTQTCDGDGDGTVESGGVASQTGEIYGFWQHLANAGLVEGTYTGIAGAAGSGDDSLAAENVPPSRLSSAGWDAVHRNTSGHADFFDGAYGNTFQVGDKFSGGTHYAAAFLPEEAWGVDIKIDDGLPAQGKVFAIHYDECTDAADETDFDSDYLLTDTTKRCALLFKNAF